MWIRAEFSSYVLAHFADLAQRRIPNKKHVDSDNKKEVVKTKATIATGANHRGSFTYPYTYSNVEIAKKPKKRRWWHFFTRVEW
jgi:hypothetical protein